ncbi:MAG: MraY family glycosyltransferase [Candidatus Auribacterota bacterium]|nr:MraY family glycosyltransferase [Candidatus Auribacterota bacterium]
MEIIFFLITLTISFLITPFLIRLASRFNFNYDPRRGSIQTRTVPLPGSLSIYISFLIATSLAFLFSRGEMLGEYDYHYLGIILGGSLMVALGIYDDARGVPFPIKLVVQILAALILIGFGYRITFITNPLGGEIAIGWWGTPILIIWLVGITNALSLINRIDGLACGIAGIVGITLFFASLNGPPFVPVIALAIAAGCAGFLRYNFYPARIFLGSTGTLFLGFVLAAIAVQGSFKVTASISLTLPLLALSIAVFTRIRRAFGEKSSIPPDRQLHNRLLNLGYSPKQTVLILYLLQANLGVIALVMSGAGRVLALAIFFLVGSMMYILFTLMNDYRARIRKLEKSHSTDI